MSNEGELQSLRARIDDMDGQQAMTGCAARGHKVSEAAQQLGVKRGDGTTGCATAA